MLFYTLTASLPLLVMIIIVKSQQGTLNFELIKTIKLQKLRTLIYLAGVGAFLVKIPMYLVHL
jgi:NADH:ubiquinone oxidoreductase subunit 4 (subunit M)